MEKQQKMDTSRGNDDTVMESFNQMQQSKSAEDLMYQRMKNRERQRRYRERKKLIADMNKSVKMNDPTPLPLPQPPPPPPSSAIVPYQRVTRVRCTRDWKRDARQAHTAKQKIENALPQHMVSEHKSKDGMSTTPSAMENGEKSKGKSIRRDWKAEARNKKGETNLY